MSWNLGVPDWEERIRSGRSLVPELPLWDAQARRAVAIYDRLRIPDVPGTPSFAEAGGDWFREIVAALFGSLDPVTRQRLIRELFLLVPKKNAKTTGGAALMLTALLMNDRPRAEFLLVAPTQQITDISFGQVAGMIDLDEELTRRIHVQSHLKKITYRATGGTLQVKSFDPKVMTGVKPAGVLVDELHVIAESADADRVIGQIRGGLVSQTEGFLAFITTQSERPPRGVFKAELAKARALRDGRAQGKMLPVLYEFPADIGRASVMQGELAPWEDPSVWHMVTPNRNRSVTVDRLVEDYNTAKLAGPEELLRWASQHLNIEIGLGLLSDRWAGADFWSARRDKSLSLDALIERSEVIVVGVDGGGLDDLLAIAVIGREKETRRWLHWGKAWAGRVVLERRKSEASTLRDMEADGDLVIIEELGQDIDEVVAVCRRIDETGLLAMVGLDPMGVGALVDALAEAGIEGERRVVGVSQGYQLTKAIWTVERKLADRSFVHCGQPLLAWAVGNAKVEPRGNAVIVTKQVAGRAKIDPLMALFTAAALMGTNPEAMTAQPSAMWI